MWRTCTPSAPCCGRTTALARATSTCLWSFCQWMLPSSIGHFALLNDLRQGLASRVDLVMADAVRNPIGRQAIDAIKEQIFAM